MKPLCLHFQMVLLVCKILQNEIWEFLLNFWLWPHLALTGFNISIVIIVIIIIIIIIHFDHRHYDHYYHWRNMTSFSTLALLAGPLFRHRIFDLNLGMSSNKYQGPVLRRPISANPGLNFNPGLLFFSSKASPLRSILSLTKYDVVFYVSTASRPTFQAQNFWFEFRYVFK